MALVWVCFECDKRVFGEDSAGLCECGGSFEELDDAQALMVVRSSVPVEVQRPVRTMVLPSGDNTGDQSELVRTLQEELRRLERENTKLRDQLGQA